jgi:hypothetical protein
MAEIYCVAVLRLSGSFRVLVESFLSLQEHISAE